MPQMAATAAARHGPSNGLNAVRRGASPFAAVLLFTGSKFPRISRQTRYLRRCEKEEFPSTFNWFWREQGRGLYKGNSICLFQVYLIFETLKPDEWEESSKWSCCCYRNYFLGIGTPRAFVSLGPWLPKRVPVGCEQRRWGNTPEVLPARIVSYCLLWKRCLEIDYWGALVYY